MLLCNDLQRVANRNGEQSAIDEGRPGEPDAGWLDLFEDQCQQQAHHGTGGELQEGQADRVVAADEEAHQQHVQAPDEGAGQLDPVARGYGEVLADAQQRHAGDGEKGAKPGSEAGLVANDQSQ